MGKIDFYMCSVEQVRPVLQYFNDGRSADTERDPIVWEVRDIKRTTHLTTRLECERVQKISARSEKLSLTLTLII